MNHSIKCLRLRKNSKWAGRCLVLLASIVVFLVALLGCRTPTEDLPSKTSADVSANETPYWTEVDGRFYTNDVGRAQAEVPFPIILPTYFPKTSPGLPMIDAPVRRSTEQEIDVRIRYLFATDKKVDGNLILHEANYMYTLGNPVLNPQLETIEVDGIQVTKSRSQPGDSTAYFSFDHSDIFYVLEFRSVPDAESLKVAESIIRQFSRFPLQ